ncbi:hypothetical protein MRX96_023743 [Rhipicephalus microplus]
MGCRLTEATDAVADMTVFAYAGATVVKQTLAPDVSICTKSMARYSNGLRETAHLVKVGSYHDRQAPRIGWDLPEYARHQAYPGVL